MADFLCAKLVVVYLGPIAFTFPRWLVALIVAVWLVF